ncbi:2TM domain-containing protein [Cochleicola gelatinilyticus]|uniref:Histidine kinase n=1 Tax=Cochleicola gelatinilyticus TaxID=1763537 RepID=A0A167HQT3_9FLAO|nr:2TM domain-containing protein [Cochleicola gelatinilyticus]OAB78869.1 histidine kinase [Cochleicola gelatinilyticus]
MNLLKEFGKAFFIGVLIFIVVSLIEYANGFNVLNAGNLWERFLYNQLFSVGLYMANMGWFYYTIKKYQQDLFKTKPLLRGIAGAIVITLLTILLIRFIAAVVFSGIAFSDFVLNERPIEYIISFVIAMVVITIFYAVYYYRYKQERKVKEQKFIAGAASAQFDALKNQLDPHFLFNSLNVLTSLIEENPKAATKFTTSLSKVYRYVLEQKNKELVTVTEELKFAKLYMALIEMRFEDSIVFTMPEVLLNPEAKVVPLSLQLLLENAVKHNQVMPSKKLHITISEEKGNLVITNTMQPKEVIKKSTGVGLRNIVQRYQLLTKLPVSIQQDEKTFRVAIPMLTKEITIMNTQETYISNKKYATAKERVEKLKGFYIHLTIYLLFVPVFIWLNYISRAGFPWAAFPILGWGFGVLGHASDTFNYNPFFGKNWEQRKIKELMNKDQ